ncbi:MAG: hypothetical protein JWN09_1347 [Microbacteriaceae bacterium]|nr:hypothetical protein [Microbacteriaceae bacterium]
MTIGGASRGRGVRFAVLVTILSVLGLSSIGATSASATESDTIASLVNQARAAAGLPGLAHNPAMDAVAERWAQQMGAANTMSHNPSYASQIPTGWTRAGENVAMGQPTPAAMHDAWMNSAGHRANILGDFTDIGIAFVIVNGVTWGVEDFGKYAGHASAPVQTAVPATAPPAAKAAAPVAAAPVPVAPVPAAPPVPAAALPSAAPSSAPGTIPGADVGAVPRPSASASVSHDPLATQKTEKFIATARKTAPSFPVAYGVGIVLVVLGLVVGSYRQLLHRRARRSAEN